MTALAQEDVTNQLATVMRSQIPVFITDIRYRHLLQTINTDCLYRRLQSLAQAVQRFYMLTSLLQRIQTVITDSYYRDM